MNDIAVSKLLKAFEESFCDLYKDKTAGPLLKSYIKGLSDEKRNAFKKVLIKNSIYSTDFASHNHETIVPTTRGQVLGLIAAALTSLMSVRSLRTVVASIIKQKFFDNKINSDIIDEVLKLAGTVVPAVVASLIALTRLHGSTQLGLKEKPRLKG